MNMHAHMYIKEEQDDINLKMVSALQRGQLDKASELVTDETILNILNGVAINRYGNGWCALSCVYDGQTYELPTRWMEGFFDEPNSILEAYKHGIEIPDHPFYANLPAYWHEKREWPIVKYKRKPGEIME